MNEHLERHFALITLQGVKELLSGKRGFACEYAFVGRSQDGKPKYNVIYDFDGKKYILVKTKFDLEGPKARTLNLWPGLYYHHREYGDGSSLVLHNDDTISTIPVDGSD